MSRIIWKDIWINAINHWVSHLNRTQFVILNLNIIVTVKLNWQKKWKIDILKIQIENNNFKNF